MVVDRRALDVGERQPSQSDDGLVGRHSTGLHVVEECPEAQFVHPLIVPRRLRNNTPTQMRLHHGSDP